MISDLDVIESILFLWSNTCFTRKSTSWRVRIKETSFRLLQLAESESWSNLMINLTRGNRTIFLTNLYQETSCKYLRNRLTI